MATTIPLNNPEAFVAALDQAGVEVQFNEARGQSAMGITPQAVSVGGEQLWVFHSPDRIEASSVLAAFTGKQHVWANDYLIVQYHGMDGGTILLIDSLFGEALIKPQAAGDEPYPPAIPAAIRAVAEDLGAQPAEIEVLAYEMAEWDDTCLGLGDPGEICAEQETTGWRIVLRYETHTVDVHTDFLGDNIRWFPQ
jgi:hypothetical protein